MPKIKIRQLPEDYDTENGNCVLCGSGLDTGWECICCGADHMKAVTRLNTLRSLDGSASKH